MARFRIDFLPRPPRARRTGAVVLGLGLLVAAAGAWSVQTLRAERVAVQSEIERIAAARAPRNRGALAEAAVPPERQREIMLANRIAGGLNRPWSGLFDAVERSAVDGVVLLALQPDPVEGTLRLTGEARALTPVLDYLVVLQQQSVLAEVRLESHETQQQAAQRPVRFVAAARWQVRP
jgi:Tfp pilus assembly protein PilN